MSLSFQERFGNRTSLISKFGTIDTSNSVAISKPLHSQIFPEPRRQINSIRDSPQTLRHEYIAPPSQAYPVTPRASKVAEPFPRKQTLSAKPFRIISEEKKQEAMVQLTDYTPYTLKDYQNIKPGKYYQLGGLGPANIGTDDWRAKKEIVQRRNEYIKVIKGDSLPPSSLRKPENKCEKSTNPGRFQGNSTISSVLEELEKFNKLK